jgi:hypothetical protein
MLLAEKGSDPCNPATCSVVAANVGARGLTPSNDAIAIFKNNADQKHILGPHSAAADKARHSL